MKLLRSSAPAWLPIGARPLYEKLRARRLALGREVYPDVIAWAARAIYDAVAAQRAGGATPEGMQRARRYAAREGLIRAGHERFGAVNADGVDADLAKLLKA